MADTAFVVRDAARLAVPYVDGTPRPTRMVDDEVVPVPFTPGTGIVFTPSRAFDTMSFPSGGGGMVGSASELLRFFERLRRGGDPIVSVASAAQMTRNQNATLPSHAQGPTPGWGFGFGGAVLVDPSAASTPQSPGTWQWGGVYGHSWFVDPQRRLTVVTLTNTALEGLYGRFPIDVRDAIYRAL
jgi:CubicO group peptidase (beta-lactamase class C family)